MIEITPTNPIEPFCRSDFSRDSNGNRSRQVATEVTPTNPIEPFCRSAFSRDRNGNRSHQVVTKVTPTNPIEHFVGATSVATAMMIEASRSRLKSLLR